MTVDRVKAARIGDSDGGGQLGFDCSALQLEAVVHPM